MSGRSYTGEARRRQSPVIAAGAAIIVAISLTGCARLGFNEASAQHSPVKPAAAVASEHVDPSDWRMVKSALARIPADKPDTELAWQNPQTGSDGTITALAAMAKGGGPFCRAFATTVNDLRGIRRYRGQACQTNDGNWQLTQVSVDEGTT